MGLFNWGKPKPEDIDNHCRKFIPEEFFKVGEWVECIKLDYLDTGRGVEVGGIYKVEYVGYTHLKFKDIDWAFRRDCFMRIPERYYNAIRKNVSTNKEKTMRVNNLTKHLGNSAAVEQAIKSGANPLRCTGRTTGLAFEYIAQAYKNPNQWIPVYDHCLDYPSRRNLLKQIQHILVYLDYKHFQFSKIDCKFRFNLWDEETQSEDFVVVGGKRYKLVKE